MSVSDEAVEAAARFIRDASGTHADRGYVRAVLEVAAPHILNGQVVSVSDEAVQCYLSANFRPDVAADLLAAAQPLMAIAWDEAAASIIDEHGNPITPTNVDNPYRTDPA